MSYQVFISYRRDGGEELARLIYERLTREGYQTFLDVESLRSGKFNSKLLDIIQECQDFLLILPAEALDRCKDPEDWVRLEIECALSYKKNIIPVMMRQFVFPDGLPISMKELPYYNGISASMEFFDGVIEKLKRMLQSISGSCEQEDLFPVTVDPDFPEWYKMERWMRRWDNDYKTPEDDNGRGRAVMQTLLEEIYSGERALTPRKVIDEINYKNNYYCIYDVFMYNDKKVVYGIKKGIAYSEPQEIAFFYVNGNILKEIHNFEERIDLLIYYSGVIRMLDMLPQCLLKSAENYTRAMFSTHSIPEQLFGGAEVPVNDITRIFSRSFNPNITVPRICGWKKIPLLGKKVICVTNTDMPVYIARCEKLDSDYLPVDDRFTNAILSRYDGWYYKSKIKTCLENYTVLDIVRLYPVKKNFIILAYPQIKGNIDWLKREPTYFLVSLDDMDILSIDKIQNKNLSFYLDDCGVLERFALIEAQIDSHFPAVFEKGEIVR